MRLTHAAKRGMAMCVPLHSATDVLEDVCFHNSSNERHSATLIPSHCTVYDCSAYTLSRETPISLVTMAPLCLLFRKSSLILAWPHSSWNIRQRQNDGRFQTLRCRKGVQIVANGSKSDRKMSSLSLPPSGLLRVGVSQAHYENAAHRAFGFATDESDKASEWQMTEMKNGGIGRTGK